MLNSGVIGKFVIIFDTMVRESGNHFREGSRVGRIIKTSDKECAEIIAKAMVGEEIYPNIYLAEVVSVGETDDNPFICGFCSEHYTWERVFNILGLTNGLRGPLQLFFHSVGPVRIISGVVFNRDQRRVAFSRIP